jgi:SAM-dependent methyltransferase
MKSAANVQTSEAARPAGLELAAPAHRLLTLHYGLTIFLGAFLLFQVQPILGKLILPWFGGSASVWTTCMLFFQVLLLAGYLYAHCVVTYLSARRQTYVHLALLVVSLAMLPLGLDESLRPTGAEDPTVRILLLLTFSAGLPYFSLATTGPLVQAWFAREQTGAVPYRLFALSNLGCLVALLGYPTAVEPFIPTQSQAQLWSILFVIFVGSYVLLAWRARSLPVLRENVRAVTGNRPSLFNKLVWVALAACPSMLLLAITSHITANIAPVPLLWVIPLALYLLSFILCFGGKPYNRKLYRPLLLVGLFAVALMPFLGGIVPMLANLVIHLVTLFVACMVCHGELAARQPNPWHLTSYYLMLAIGGATGGLFIGLVAPYSFNDHYELSVALVSTAVVWSLAWGKENRHASGRLVNFLFVFVLIVSLVGFRVVHHRHEQKNADLMARNFYGRLKVATGHDAGESFRYLMHGGIVHGMQLIQKGRQEQPTTYYSLNSGIGRTLLAFRNKQPLKVAVIGLGVGTLLTYGRSGDYFRLYEIDPLVVDIARSHFTYLAQSAARSDIVLGDARLNLESETPQEFDIVALDAFSGDAIPVHLLTREAFRNFIRHLHPDGVLAVHVTNQYLRIDQVVKAAADELGFTARLVTEQRDPARLVTGSQWVLVSRNTAILDKTELRESLSDIQTDEGLEVWRDDYSSLIKLIKWKSPGY